MAHPRCCAAQWVGKVVFVQIAGPAFTDAPEHKLQRQTHELVGRINGRFGTLSRVAVHYLYALVIPLSSPVVVVL